MVFDTQYKDLKAIQYEQLIKMKNVAFKSLSNNYNNKFITLFNG